MYERTTGGAFINVVGLVGSTEPGLPIEGVALPQGFIPDMSVPANFSLQATLTTEELEDPHAAQAFRDNGLRQAYRYGRDAVLTASNREDGWGQEPGAIALATFIRQGARPLSRVVRIRQSISRMAFGIKCDINF